MGGSKVTYLLLTIWLIFNPPADCPEVVVPEPVTYYREWETGMFRPDLSWPETVPDTTCANRAGEKRDPPWPTSGRDR